MENTVKTALVDALAYRLLNDYQQQALLAPDKSLLQSFQSEMNDYYSDNEFDEAVQLTLDDVVTAWKGALDTLYMSGEIIDCHFPGHIDLYPLFMQYYNTYFEKLLEA